MKQILCLLLCACSAALASAQDKIYTRLQKTPIECEVTEVSVNEIKYKPVGHPIPIVTMDKQDVIKIVYQSGEVFMINNPLKDFAMYGEQHKWNAKIDLLSPLLGYTGLLLEHSVKPGRSVEYNLNVIGLGKNQYLATNTDPLTGYPKDYFMNARGAGVGIGMKFLRLPDYVNGQIRLRHILQGSYIKPAIAANVYQRDFAGSVYDPIAGFSRTKIVTSTCYAINPNITFGRQWIFDNTISMEFYTTIGFSADNVRDNESKARDDVGNQFLFNNDNAPVNSFGYTRFSSGNFGLSLMAGLRVGYLFDFKKHKGEQKK